MAEKYLSDGHTTDVPSRNTRSKKTITATLSQLINQVLSPIKSGSKPKVDEQERAKSVDQIYSKDSFTSVTSESLSLQGLETRKVHDYTLLPKALRKEKIYNFDTSEDDEIIYEYTSQKSKRFIDSRAAVSDS